MSIHQVSGVRAKQAFSDRRALAALAVVAALAVSGCAGMRSGQAPQPDQTRCTPAAAGDALVGSWLSVRKQSGVAGELRTHIVLQADGTMRYAEQLSRKGRAPQGLAETGCWQRDGKVVVLRTVESNGSPVDLDDPIYVNRYQLTRESGERIGLRAPDGAQLDARRMPADYRLPF